MMSEKSNLKNVDKSFLETLSKSELINLILKQNSPKPIPTPRKSVKSMVQQYEDNVSSPPTQFRDDYKPIPTPRTKKPLQAPIPTPRTIISLVKKALNGFHQNIRY